MLSANTTHAFRIALFITIGVVFVSCGGSEQKPAQEVQAEKPKPYVRTSPEFNADSAFYFVDKQVEFGPRVTNTEAHKKCGDWMVSELKKYSDQVVEQKARVKKFDGQQLDIRNIIGVINPKATRRVLLCAHWDSRPYADEDQIDRDRPILGANDGASGVGVLMQVAAVLKSKPVDVGVDIVFFDAEDLGKSQFEDSYCLGSQYWSKNLHVPGYKAEFGILLDMVGASGATFAWEEQSVMYAQDVLRLVWDKAHKMGYGNYFIYLQKGGITDDHVYVNEHAKIPTIDIIHYDQRTRSGFPEHWHTHRDNINAIDRQTLKAVGQTLLEVLYTL